MKQLRNKTLSDIINKNFKSTDTLFDFGINFNTHVDITLGNICTQYNLDIESVEYELNHLEQFFYRKKSKLNEITLKRLVDLIHDEYHVFFYKNASIVEINLAKSVSEFGDSFPELLKVYDIFTDLKEELIIHMNDEEEVLFPLMIKSIGPQTTNMVMREIEHDHHTMVEKLVELRKMANGYKAPTDSSIITKTYKLLRSIDKNLEQHIYLENNVLFRSFKLRQELEKEDL